MPASLLSGSTGKALIDLIQRDQIIPGDNIQVTSRDENGTFLRRSNGGQPPDQLFNKLQIMWLTDDSPGFELERDIDFLGVQSIDLDEDGQQPGLINTYVEGGNPFVLDVEKAKADGEWSGSLIIGLLASWDTTESVSDSGHVEVTYRGIKLTKTIFPGNESGAPSGREDAGNTPVGSVVVFDNGTFLLS